MPNRSGLHRYLYWSDRAIRRTADDLGIDLGPRWRTKLSVARLPLLGVGIDFERPARNLSRDEVAGRVERGTGEHAIEDFVSPPPARFAKGISRVEFAHFICEERGRVVLNTHLVSSDGTNVGLALFGSVDNLPGWVGSNDPQPAGWTSSAMWDVLSWLHSRCTESPSEWDDQQSLSVEALRIADHQGTNEYHDERPEDPWKRGFTFADADAEWFVEVYSDVVLERERWHLDEKVDRIIVGSPLWIRTTESGFRRYSDERKLLNEDQSLERWHRRR